MNKRPPGRLKIFLGYAPAVGKSHALLDAANRKKIEGVNIHIACLDVELSFELSPMISALAGSFIPPLSKELDIDSVLALKPDLVIVDRLAFNNPPGSRHPRRYQDVEELLSSGMDVYTTLNVQELESLRDLMSLVLGRAVTETIPDRIFQNASIIEFVDLPPEEIIQRLMQKIESGKITEDEVKPYLSIDRLSKLREIALKRAAGVLENIPIASSQYQSLDKSILPKNGSILVCVSSHPISEKLVRAGKRQADENHSPWYVLYIETPDRVIPRLPNRERLENILKLAEDLGAGIIRKTALDIPTAISAIARENNAAKIILGAPQRHAWSDWIGKTSLERLIQLVGSVEIMIIKYDGGKGISRSEVVNSPIRNNIGYLKAIGIVTITTAVSYPLHLIIEPVNLVMLYLVAVMACAFYYGRGPGILATILGVLSFDYFMVAPRFTLTVADTQYLLTFLGFFIISLVVSGLAGKVRTQVNASIQREDQTASLYTLSQELTNAYDRSAVFQVIMSQIQLTFVRNCIIWTTNGKEVMAFPELSSHIPDSSEKRAVEWVVENQQPAGRGTDTFPDLYSIFYPMVVGNQSVGVLEVSGESSSILMNQEKRKLLEAYCGMAALAIERTRLVEEQKAAQISIETERLQNALLNSISHDLRTPLATITGVLSSLRESEQSDQGVHQMDDRTKFELIDAGWEEAERLNRVVGNLLDISRLESGALHLNLQFGDLEGIIGAVLGRLKSKLEFFDLQVNIPTLLPQVLFDPGLLEQVLYNLLDNAIKYSTTLKEISISIFQNPEEILIAIQDQGIGIPIAELNHVFDKFYRSKTSANVSGSGLGLAICKGIIESHSGKIWAESNRPQGTTIWFSLPLNKD